MSSLDMTPPLWVVSVIVFVALFWTLMFALMPKHGTVVYDCRMAEISPDFPIEVKNECRKKLSGRI
jgi:hypothetical protein